VRDDVLGGRSAGLPVRRIGLEHEFFLVDRTGAPCDLADPFLWRCRQAAESGGLDPRCFKEECVKSLVEVTTPPSADLAELTRNYLGNLALALEVGAELGLGLYPLGTYPLPIMPTVREDPGYRMQARTIGYKRFLHAGRCAGTHLHLELPAGTVWPDVKLALDAPVAAQEELLALYNLATALDPALVALTRACPFYEGRVNGFAARVVHYRGILGFEGLYANLQEVGALSAYATHVEDLVDQQTARYGTWFAAMDSVGIEHRLFASTGGNLHRASWNPVRLTHHGTVEIRGMDGNYPEVILAVCALICGAVERVRREHLRVRPSQEARAFEVDGDTLLVPCFSYLGDELLGAAVSGGVEDPVVEAYLDSLFTFASVHAGTVGAIEPLKRRGGGYKTTESEIRRSFSPLATLVGRDEGLRLARESSRRLREEVSLLSRGQPERL
jgi:carboxylate-amine ligase